MFSGIVLHGSSKESLQGWAHREEMSEIVDENHHTCGKNMPLIQCTGGVLPKLGEVRSYANICQQCDGTWTKTLLYCPIHGCFFQLTKLIPIEPLIPVLEECHTCDDVWEPTWRQLGRFGFRICYVPFESLDIPQIINIRNILKTGQLHCSMVSKTMDPSWTSNSCEMQVAWRSWSCNKRHLECNSRNAIHNIMLKVIFCN